MNARKALIEAYKAAVTAIAKRGTLSNGRHDVAAAERAAGVETSKGVYAHATSTKADFVAYCEACIAEMIEADHAEALEINEEVEAGAAIMKNKAIGAYWLACETMKVVDAFREWNAMHAEALAFNAEVDEVAASEQWDDWANQHDSRKTVAQMIDSDHDEALEMDRARHEASDTGRQAQLTYNLSDEVARRGMVAQAHHEALRMNSDLDEEYASIERLAPKPEDVPRFKAIAAKYIVGELCK